jgi:hypothetical protein
MRQTVAAVQGDDETESRPSDGTESSATDIHRDATGREMVRRHHLRLDRRRLAVSGGAQRPVFAAHRRLGDGPADDRHARQRCVWYVWYGLAANPAGGRTPFPHRPGQSVNQPAVSAAADRAQRPGQYERQGPLL